MGDLIDRQAAIDVLEERLRANGYSNVGLVSELNRSIGYLMRLPSAEPKTDEESELRFYYVESIDDYWIGQRLDNFYYADWHKDLGFVWSKSRYLLWGEHIVDENTLWKEHTYPSEPIEIPFTEWIVGFVKKYYAEPKTGGWIPCNEIMPTKDGYYLVTVEFDYGREIEMGWLLDGEWVNENSHVTVAWQRLPEPYEAS